MIRLAAHLLLIAASCLAQDSGLDALKARQAKLKAKGATTEERRKARADRGAELTRVIEVSIAEIAKEGIDFKKLSDDEATSRFPKFEAVSGRAVDGLVVHVENGYTKEPELAVQPVGGRMLVVSWAFYKDGSFKVGENPARGGRVFFTGKDYLDPKAVLGSRKEIKAGLIKALSAP